MAVERETNGERRGGDRRDPSREPVHVVEKIDRVRDSDQPEDRYPDIEKLVTGDRKSWPDADDDRCSDQLPEQFLIRLDVEDVVEKADEKQERARSDDDERLGGLRYKRSVR